jgi:hypothetical protein
MVDGQITRGVGGALVARAPLPVLTPPRPEDASTEPLPGSRAVQGVVAAAVRRSCVVGAATARSARQHAADGAELHGSQRASAVTYLTLVTLDCRSFDIETSVNGGGGSVYSPAVLRLRDESEPFGHMGADRPTTLPGGWFGRISGPCRGGAARTIGGFSSAVRIPDAPPGPARQLRRPGRDKQAGRPRWNESRPDLAPETNEALRHRVRPDLRDGATRQHAPGRPVCSTRWSRSPGSVRTHSTSRPDAG